MPESVSTTCRTCGRCVYVDHVDRDGNCVQCAVPEKAAPAKPEPTTRAPKAPAPVETSEI